MEECGNLILTIKHGRGFTVGAAKITVIRTGEKGVRISIAAPKDIPIIRDDAGLKTRGGEG
jgi:sRNA-binding carbon storage regulator CsrA